MLRSTRSLFQSSKQLLSSTITTKPFHTSVARRSAQVGEGLPEWAQKAPPTLVSRLSNGLRVVTESYDAQTATVGVYLNAGTVYENEKNNGVAHFLEHMTFKGTKRRTQQELEVEIENIGGSLNAYTSREQTAFIGHSTKEHIPQVVDILADLLQNSLHKTEAIEAERGVILTEMASVNNRSEELLFDLLHSSAFPNCSLGYTILGPEENIRTISQKDLREYIQSHYTAERMFLVGAGAVDHSHLVNIAEKLFSNLPPTSASPVAPYPSNAFQGGLVTVPDDTMDVTHVIIAHEALPASHHDQLCMGILQGMFGSWEKRFGVGKTTIPLMETIAKKELVHSIQPFSTLYQKTALFGLYAIAKPESVRELMEDIYSYFDLLSRGISEHDLMVAKQKSKNMIAMHLDNYTSTCEDIGHQFLMHGRRISLPELFLRIDSVTTEDMKRVTNFVLKNQFPAIAAMGDLKTLPTYEEILEMGK